MNGGRTESAGGSAKVELLFCGGLFPKNGYHFFLNDSGTNPIISGPSVVQKWMHSCSDLCVVFRLCGATFSSVAPSL